MIKKVYMVMPDTNSPFDLGKFHAYILSLDRSGYIDGWWHYLPGGMYFFASHLQVNEIYNLFIQHMPGKQFIVMEVDPKNQQGWLPKQAWDWFASFK